MLRLPRNLPTISIHRQKMVTRPGWTCMKLSIVSFETFHRVSIRPDKCETKPSVCSNDFPDFLSPAGQTQEIINSGINQHVRASAFSNLIKQLSEPITQPPRPSLALGNSYERARTNSKARETLSTLEKEPSQQEKHLESGGGGGGKDVDPLIVENSRNTRTEPSRPVSAVSYRLTSGQASLPGEERSKIFLETSQVVGVGERERGTLPRGLPRCRWKLEIWSGWIFRRWKNARRRERRPFIQRARWKGTFNLRRHRVTASDFNREAGWLAGCACSKPRRSTFRHCVWQNCAILSRPLPPPPPRGLCCLAIIVLVWLNGVILQGKIICLVFGVWNLKLRSRRRVSRVFATFETVGE